jgi:hypothetical protein
MAAVLSNTKIESSVARFIFVAQIAAYKHFLPDVSCICRVFYRYSYFLG